MLNKPTTVMEYLEYFVANQSRLLHRSITPGTIKTYKQRERHLKTFLISNGMSEIKPLGVTIHIIREYEMYLTIDRKLCNNYAMKCIHILDRILRLAMENGDIPTNPARLFKYHYERDRPIIYLSRFEVDKIKNLTLTRNLSITRTLFLFGCYTGLSLCDILNFKYYQHVIPGPNGKEWIYIKRKKNGSDTYLPLLPQAKEILDYYYNKLPKKTDQSINRGLKIIAQKAGIKAYLTSHVARKTFGNILHNELNVPLETVSRMLGHKSIKTTERFYVKTNTKKIMHDMEGIEFFSAA